VVPALCERRGASASLRLLFDCESHIHVGAVILGSEAYHDGALVGFVFTGDHAPGLSIGVGRQCSTRQSQRLSESHHRML
jgi:hypothetical protein